MMPPAKHIDEIRKDFEKLLQNGTLEDINSYVQRNPGFVCAYVEILTQEIEVNTRRINIIALNMGKVITDKVTLPALKLDQKSDFGGIPFDPSQL